MRRDRESAAILLLQHGWKLEDVSRVLAERVQYVPYPSQFNPRFHPYYRQPELPPWYPAISESLSIMPDSGETVTGL